MTLGSLTNSDLLFNAKPLVKSLCSVGVWGLLAFEQPTTVRNEIRVVSISKRSSVLPLLPCSLTLSSYVQKTKSIYWVLINRGFWYFLLFLPFALIKTNGTFCEYRIPLLPKFIQIWTIFSRKMSKRDRERGTGEKIPSSNSEKVKTARRIRTEYEMVGFELLPFYNFTEKCKYCTPAFGGLVVTVGGAVVRQRKSRFQSFQRRRTKLKISSSMQMCARGSRV